MKKRVLQFVLMACLFIISFGRADAVEFNVLVLPTDIMSVCDNYFCFPEPSEVIAEDVIQNLSSYKNINSIDLSEVRTKLSQDSDLKALTEKVLTQYEETEQIDFESLKYIAQEFGVKSVAIVSCYAITDRSSTRRSLWEVLEISSAFKITYPFNLTTTAVLVDCVNNVVMWSSKYNKNVSDSNGYFLAQNQAQAASHLEKLKQYSKNNVGQNIAQNIHLRFFPKDVRTFNVNKSTDIKPDDKQFNPTALDHLITPTMVKEIEQGSNSDNHDDDFMFEF